jgi:hypothetical protein
MIAQAKDYTCEDVTPTWHQDFLQLLPAIRRHATIAFRHLNREQRDEATAEVIANALSAFVRLVELGKIQVAYASALARFGVAQFHAGRRVGTKTNTRDVTSPAAQRKHGYTVDRLDRFDGCEGQWKETIVEDRRAGPAQTAAFRLDYPQWLARLSARDRQIAVHLAEGERTKNIARRFGLTPGRISQLRAELADDWTKFHGEVQEATTQREETGDRSDVNRSRTVQGKALARAC